MYFAPLMIGWERNKGPFSLGFSGGYTGLRENNSALLYHSKERKAVNGPKQHLDNTLHRFESTHIVHLNSHMIVYVSLEVRGHCWVRGL
jgi:hypothetical protein